MSIENETMVDGLGTDHTTGEAVLLISDHLDWLDVHAHLLALERKINGYLQFMESGQLIETLPDAAGRRIRIRVVQQFPPPAEAMTTLDSLATQLASNGVALGYGPLPELH